MIRQLGWTATITCSLAAAACTTPGAEAISARDARLSQAGGTVAAARAWYSTAPDLQYEAYGPIDGVNRWHHLDVLDFTPPQQLTLEPGVVYVGGPSVAGRLEDYANVEGLVVGAPDPWIDFVSCDGDVMAEAVPCHGGDRIEVTVEDLGAAGERVNYHVFLPGEQTPSIAGSFLAQPGTMLGTPR